jgi:hypothetical protein
MARCPAACTHPPHRLGTDQAPTVPAQPPCRRRKRDQDGQRTPQGLQLPARLLIGLHPQFHSPGGSLRDVTPWGHRPTRRRH